MLIAVVYWIILEGIGTINYPDYTQIKIGDAKRGRTKEILNGSVVFVVINICKETNKHTNNTMNLMLTINISTRDLK